jgi:hypothetical protein
MFYRVRCAWTGGITGPGVSTFFFDPAATDLTALKSWFNSVSTWIPNTVTITIPANVDQVDETTGNILGGTTLLGNGTAVGSATPAAFSLVSGALVQWYTSDVVNSHRVRGRTFLVPLAGVAYGNTGQVSAGVLSSIITANATFRATTLGGQQRIWARPFKGRLASAGPPPKPALPARLGSSHIVTSSSVRAAVAVLRSRRD